MENAEGLVPTRLRTLPSRLINQLATTAGRLIDQALSGTGSRPYHYALLAALAEFGPASQAELGRRTGIDRSDIVAAINDLADRELVHRTPDPDDRRRNIITLTPAGDAHLEGLDRVVAEVQATLLEPLTASDRERFVELLVRLNQAQRPNNWT